MNNYTEIEIIRTWLDEHWTDVLKYYGAKMKNASQVEETPFDSEKIVGMLCSYVYEGVNKVVRVKPSSFVEGISGLSGELARWCESMGHFAEAQGNYAESAAANADAAADEVTEAITDIAREKEAAIAAAEAANTAATNADTKRQEIEANEATRQANETGRVNAETARVNEYGGITSQAATDHSAAVSDHTQAGTDHTRYESDHTTAASDHTQAAADHTASVTATTEASRVNATMEGMTVTITDRNGTSRSQNIGFEIYRVYPSVAAMNADASNVPQGKFVIIATVDPTSEENARLYCKNSQGGFTFLSDLDQAATHAFADWMENYKPVIESDHTRAESDHSTASTDHTTAVTDHTVATTDHTTAVTDSSMASSNHTRAENDHTVAGTDHTTASSDHSTATEDHGIASTDHTTAESDHTVAESDHALAASDHSTAGSDHTTAASDHTQADSDHSRAETDHTDSVTATVYANNQGDYAKNMADHPAYLADGTSAHPGDAGYLYSWDYTTQQYVKGARLSIDFDSMTQEQKEELAQAVLAAIGFDTVPTENSEKAVTSGGLYVVFGNVTTSIGNEVTRAQTAEGALDTRVTAVEGIQAITAAQVTAAWDEIFNS